MIPGVATTLHVECYAGHKADERPLRFSLVPPGESRAAPATSGEPANRPAPRTYEVKEVLDQWYGPGSQCFKVLADDGNLYILRHDQTEDTWTLDSFRRHDNSGVGEVRS